MNDDTIDDDTIRLIRYDDDDTTTTTIDDTIRWMNDDMIDDTIRLIRLIRYDDTIRHYDYDDMTDMISILLTYKNSITIDEKNITCNTVLPRNIIHFI